MLMRYRAVLFDLDDTLLDSYGVRLVALQSVFSRAGIGSPSAEELLQNPDGSPFGPILSRVATGHRVERDPYGEYQQALYSTVPGLINLYPGIKPLIEGLHGRGIKLGVVTQERRLVRMADRFAGASQDLRETGIAALFSAVVGYEDTENHKPHPEPVNLALEQLSVTPQDSIVVGDSPADIEAGRAAGCRTCLATWGSSGRTRGGIGADLNAETPGRLLSLLTGQQI